MTVVATPEIELVCKLVDDLTGIQWDADKAYLIESRLKRLVTEHACQDLTELVSRIRKGDEELKETVIDAVTTRETLFFRDDAPFAALRNKALPEIIDAKSKQPGAQRLRIWSAACSSGQEPYSLGITLLELLDDVSDWDIVISASDLSASAIESAQNGIYSDFEMSRGVSPQIKQKYFEQVPGGWRICDRVRKMVTFHQRNLLEPFGAIGPFDIIFCRNVAIYFDGPTKDDLFDRLAGVLAPHGAIFVGGSESLSAMGERWKPQHHCRGVFYQPNRKDIPEPAIVTSSRMLASAPAVTRPSASVATPQRPAPARPVSAQPVRSQPVRPTPSTATSPVFARSTHTPQGVPALVTGRRDAASSQSTVAKPAVGTPASKAPALATPGRPVATHNAAMTQARMPAKPAAATTATAIAKTPVRPTTAQIAATPARLDRPISTTSADRKPLLAAPASKGLVTSSPPTKVSAVQAPISAVKPVGAVKPASLLTKGSPAPTSLTKPPLVTTLRGNAPLTKPPLNSARPASVPGLGTAKVGSPGVATSSVFAKPNTPSLAPSALSKPTTGAAGIQAPHSLAGTAIKSGPQHAVKAPALSKAGLFTK